MRKFKVDLSKDAWSEDKNAILSVLKQVNQYRKNWENAKQSFITQLYNLIVEKANRYLDADSFTSQNGLVNSTNIRDSWSIEKIDDDHYLIKNNDLYNLGVSVFAEFGTGVVGASHSHPSSNESGYIYDMNNHGFMGWSFANWQQNLKLEWFTGYEGNKFLYNAMMDLYNNPTQVFDIWKAIVHFYKL